MSIDEILSAPWTYLAFLKGRQAEYEALRELTVGVRKRVTPVLLLREAGGSPMVKELAEALDRLRLGWGHQGPLLLDGEWLQDVGVFRMAIDAARQKGWVTLPSARLGDPPGYTDVVRTAAVSTGALLRMTREDWAGGGIDTAIGNCLDGLELVPERTDLVIDLRDIEWAHLGADELATENMLGTLPYPGRWRHVAIASSSIPPDFRGFARNELTRVPRAEAWLYEAIYERRKALPLLPVYADYVVANPGPVEEVHADYLPQNALMRYSTPADWLIARGYDINKQGSAHFPPLLRRLVAEPEFRDASYSAGDRWIAEAASGSGPTGNATIWRRAASSHHMTLVTQQIATRFAP